MDEDLLAIISMIFVIMFSVVLLVSLGKNMEISVKEPKTYAEIIRLKQSAHVLENCLKSGDSIPIEKISGSFNICSLCGICGSIGILIEDIETGEKYKFGKDVDLKGINYGMFINIKLDSDIRLGRMYVS